MSNKELDPQTFVDFYGQDAPVVAGKMKITLGQALEAEKMFCPADEEARQDPQKRLAYLAGMLAAAGSLSPEHEFLIKEQK